MVFSLRLMGALEDGMSSLIRVTTSSYCYRHDLLSMQSRPSVKCFIEFKSDLTINTRRWKGNRIEG